MPPTPHFAEAQLLAETHQKAAVRAAKAALDAEDEAATAEAMAKVGVGVGVRGEFEVSVRFTL